MKQKFPKSLADAIKEIKSQREALDNLLQQKDAVQLERDEARKQHSFERANRQRAEESAKETREQFADLKQRLLSAEKETSRLNGYMERVREDDNVADPLIEIEDRDGKRLVSKRHPAPIMNTNGLHDHMIDHWNGGSREKRKHWTSY